MAREFQFMDGFDKYQDTTLRWDNKWGYYGSGSWGWDPPTISLTGGRRGGGKLVTNGFAFGHANTGGIERWRGFTDQPKWVVGVAMKANMESGNGSVFWFKGDGEPQVYLKFCSTGRIEVWIMKYNVATGAWTDEMIGQSGPGLYINNVWNYYEMMCDAPNDLLEVRLNGMTTPIIQETIGVTGYNHGSPENYEPRPFPAYYNSLVIGNNKWTTMAGLGLGTQDYDDLYVDTGEDAEFRGDSSIYGFLPTAQGTYAEWIASESPADNFEMVDEAPPNETDYVSEGTPGKKDTYLHDPMPFSPDGATIHAVAVTLSAKKQYPGIAELAPMIRSGGVDLAGTTVTPLAESYLYYTSFFEEDPGESPGTPFSVSAVDDLEFGEEVIT